MDISPVFFVIIMKNILIWSSFNPLKSVTECKHDLFYLILFYFIAHIAFSKKNIYIGQIFCFDWKEISEQRSERSQRNDK